MPTVYVVGTPIGNLSDTSERAKATLACVDTILCEDTRVTGKLLHVMGIDTPMMSYHQHSGQAKSKQIIELLEQGNDLALVTDAGTPAISDPGGRLIEELVAHFGNELVVSPIPGASAVISALSVSGFPADEFLFLGFPPHKKGRKSFFDRLVGIKSTIAMYESTHRIFKSLAEIEQRMPERPLFVGRELTKMHETLYRGTASEVAAQLETTSSKGEFVIIVRAL